MRSPHLYHSPALTPNLSPCTQEVNRLKLMWWRGVVEDVYQNKSPHKSPVALELAAVIKTYSLNKG